LVRQEIKDWLTLPRLEDEYIIFLLQPFLLGFFLFGCMALGGDK
jgi:hypothetical protein